MQILTYIDSNLAMQPVQNDGVEFWLKNKNINQNKKHEKRVKAESVENLADFKAFEKIDSRQKTDERKLLAKQIFFETCAQIKEILQKNILALYIFLAACTFAIGFGVFYENVQLPMKKIPMTFLGEVEENLLNNAMRTFAFSESSDDVDDEGFIENSGSKLKYAVENVTFSRYKVRPGDNITSIARKFGLSNISSIISVNKISNDRSLQSGEYIKIPSVDGIIHTVTKGESLELLAKKYSVSSAALLDINDLSSSTLQIGQEIFIPGATLDSYTLKQTLGSLFMTPIKAKWRLSSPYGNRADPFTGVKKFHTGMDLACPSGTPVYSTMAGKVIEVSYNRIYGNYIVVSHANGYQSLYAHLSSTNVKKGQYVNQGAKIGGVGSTGYSTGPHLHFMVYKNGKLQNPQKLIKG